MTYSSSLVNNPRPMVLDTSVLINIHASTFGRSILTSLPNDILVPNIVVSELGYQTRKSSGEKEFVERLAEEGEVVIVCMDDKEYETYSSLVCGSSSLGDGEAATISIAASRSYIPVIDERKGRQSASLLCSQAPPAWSLDLLLHPQVVDALGSADLVDALHLALYEGRMRVHEDHCDHVVELIGLHRAMECTSLPGYKTRRQKWLHKQPNLIEPKTSN